MKNTLAEFLYSTVAAFPDNICIEDDRHRLDFAQFFSNACALAAILNHTADVNRPVVVFLPKSIDTVMSFAGILLSGHFYVPIDVKSPQQRIEKIVSKIAPYRIVSKRLYQQQLESLGISGSDIVYLDDIDSTGSTASIDDMIAACRNTTDRIIDTDPCYIMHTSGSTGIPKGVVVSHRGVADYIEWAVACLGVDENDLIGNQAPLYFDNSTLDIYLSWATGAALHLIPEATFMFPAKLVDYLEKHAVTFVFFVPSVLVSISQFNFLTPERLPVLKKIVFAGEIMPTKHLAYWQKNLPDKVYVNLYGPTEITVDCTYFIVDRIYEPAESLPIGYPCRNTDVMILNESDEPAETGEKGELCVRGSSLALGYWDNAEKSNDVFVQNPLQKHYFDRMYRTGDIVYKNDMGQIMFIGRKDSQIKHMGYRIELSEIETAAMSLEEVSNCCVLYHIDNKEITLFYQGNRAIPDGEFRKLLTQSIPTYMIPRKFHFMEKLPLTSSGKVDRKTLEHDM